MRIFVTGNGQNEHPPLTDILLHYWLPYAGNEQWLLRLPCMAMFLAGLFVLGMVLTRLTGRRATHWTMILGVLWPYGFHFGRLVGWYTPCFLLVSLCTLLYLKYIDADRPWTGFGFGLAMLALVLSNYYAWCVLGCFALDAFLALRAPRVRRMVGASCVLSMICFLPVAGAFIFEIRKGLSSGVSLSWPARIVNGGYQFYTLFVSESIAPWVWASSIPACCCIGLVLFLTFRAGRRQRFFLLYFALLFLGLMLPGVIGSKRALFISPWLVVAIGLAIQHYSGRIRQVMISALLLICLFGWYGILSRVYYAAPHFMEPWGEIADSMAQELDRGNLVITNSPALPFYMKYSWVRAGHAVDDARPGRLSHPGLILLASLRDPARLAGHRFTYVRGVNTSLTRTAAHLDEWLVSQCNLDAKKLLIPDSGADLKARIFQGTRYQQPKYRISLETYSCSP